MAAFCRYYRCMPRDVYELEHDEYAAMVRLMQEEARQARQARARRR